MQFNNSNKCTSILLCGPSGTGKTYLAKLYGKLLVGENNVIKLDMNEFNESHTVSKIIGAPPGYVGYSDNRNILEQIKDKPNAVLILDEIEKCNKSVLNLFLQILDDGYIKDSKGKLIYFDNVTIIMTTNIKLNKLCVGFNKNMDNNKIKDILGTDLLNRISKVIKFNELSSFAIDKIIKNKIDNLSKEYNINLKVSDEVINEIKRFSEYETCGVRRVDEVIKDKIESVVLDEMLINNTNININMSIFYEEQDPYKVVKDLTYNIGNTAVDLEAGKNKQDIDIVEYTHDDAKYIRKQLQVNDEAFYYLYVYITIYNEDLKDLKTNTDKIISILQSRGIKVRQAYFRQEQAFFSTLPLMINHKDVKEATKKNILTEGLVATYPFISSSICDTSGIFIGKNIYNNSLIFVDRYDQEKYKNANMCVFGTSGAGKSYYIKLNILRYRLFGIEQYVIDPEREYTGLCNKLEGTLLKLGPNSETYINVFDIRKESIEKGEKGFLANKIIKLIGFFNLVFGELDEEEKGLIEEKIIQTYEKKNINFDDKSLYKNNENKKIFKETIDMPILEDFYNILGEDEKTKKYQIKLLPFVKGSLNFFNKFTNVKLNNKLIVADVYELGEENLKYGMYIFTELFWDKIKENRKNKKAIYLDEIWRLIGVTSNKNVAGFV